MGIMCAGLVSADSTREIKDSRVRPLSPGFAFQSHEPSMFGVMQETNLVHVMTSPVGTPLADFVHALLRMK